jgi:hypothetical protein
MWTSLLSVLCFLTKGTSLRVQTRNDMFSVVLENTALLRQQGLSMDLDVLANDTVFSSSTKSCILRANYQGPRCPVNASIQFEERAQRSGLRHHYRDNMAVRPHCRFDFEIPGDFNSNSTRLVGEFCLPEHMTAGVATGDYNSDGLIDLYFTVFDGHSVMYKNRGMGKEDTETGSVD